MGNDKQMTPESDPASMSAGLPRRKPHWLRKPLVVSDGTVARALRRGQLHTVCEEARCPNRRDCWQGDRTATFMILGDRCTRNCRFCSVSAGRPSPPDPAEPERVADGVAALGLRYAVITMVARDDLPDGGAAAMAETVRAIRRRVPECRVEVLPSDFGGCRGAIAAVIAARPVVYGLNVETVRRLTPVARSGSTYERSLAALQTARELAPDLPTKSALMVGLGETMEEVCATMDDLRAAGTDLLAIGQYLQPTRAQLPVQRYWTPEEFAALRAEALRRGFAACEAGPWVRSSYRAEALYAAAVAARSARLPSDEAVVKTACHPDARHAPSRPPK